MGDVDKTRKCFTFIWKLENVNYAKCDEVFESPAFIVNDIIETNWKLSFKLYEYIYEESDLFLLRQADDEPNVDVEIDCELAFLSNDGSILHSYEKKGALIEKNGQIGSRDFPSRYEIFYDRRYFSQSTLIVRCRIWRSIGEFSKNVQCIARTRKSVEKMSSLWSIKDFSSFELGNKRTYEIKSISNGEELMTLELFLTGGLIFDEAIRLKVIPHYRKTNIYTLQVSFVDVSKTTMKCFQDEFVYGDSYESKEFTLLYSKRELMEEKSAYLTKDTLSLLCECTFSFGTLLEEIESTSLNSVPMIENKEQQDHCPFKSEELCDPKDILINDFQSMLNNSMFSDVKLKTRSKTYPAHKCILGFRSPVFKAMFSNDMKEKNNDGVKIEDLSDETVFDMLRYIYSADFKELDWCRATELFEAADKYELLNLKDICSSYLKRNLSYINACEALVIADMHQDENLKIFVQDFIVRNGKNIINSEEWKLLMETNLKLAAETMRLKFKD